MVAQFLELHGHIDDNVQEFIARMEFGFQLVMDKQDLAIILKILYFDLKGSAKH